MQGLAGHISAVFLAKVPLLRLSMYRPLNFMDKTFDRELDSIHDIIDIK